jgi:hypothetical protein
MTLPRKPSADSPRSARRGLRRVHRSPAVADPQRREAEQRAAIDVARSIAEAGRQRGAGAMIEASASHGEQRLMLSLANTLRPADPGEAFDPRFWLQTHKAIGEAIRNRAQLEKLRQHMKQFGPKKPFDGAEVARVMREQLGIPPAPPIPPQSVPLSAVRGGEG